MKDKTLETLEFDKIVKRLSEMAASDAGRKRCLQVRPSSRLEEVERMQQETDECIKALVKKGSPPLGGITNLGRVFKRVEAGGVLDSEQLLSVADLLRCAAGMKEYMKAPRGGLEEGLETLRAAVESLVPHPAVEKEIARCIEGPGQIADDASPTLRNIRRQMFLVNEEIRAKLNSMVASAGFQKYLQDAIVTTRGDRYVVPVKQEYRGSVPGIVHDQSSTGATLFIEPMAVVELNNRLRELTAKEKLEIERILSTLTLLVSDVLDDIRADMEILTELDVMFARGKLGLEMEATRPLYNTSGYINLKKARHPLIDPKAVVPISVRLGRDFDVLVITGPNTGGKTVTLKTVGLMVLMAQAGLQVPCQEGTELAVYRDVFADIGDEQSIEQSLSTFSSHMSNIVDILNHAGRGSLVLLDELGAGTDPTEGAALAMAILDYLRSKRICTIATTHYSELKQYALTKERVENASVEFDVETLSPTYRLTIGIPGKSNAFEISKRLGLSENLIESASMYLTGEEVRLEDLIGDLEKNKKEAEQEKEWARHLRQEVERVKLEYQHKVRRLEERQEKILKQARTEAKRILEHASEEAADLIKEPRSLTAVESTERNRRIEQVRQKMRWDIEKLEEALNSGIASEGIGKYPQDLKPGDPVMVTSLDQKGTVLEKYDDEALVQVGIMKIKVKLGNLEKVEEDSGSKEIKTGTGSLSKAATISAQVDVRGQVLEEAMITVDKYLDDAHLSGLKQVVIIHGTGTGVLRSGIQQLLRSNRYVASFRRGSFGEGGDGVTVVELK